MPVDVAFEERVGGGAKALPDRVGTGFPDRTNCAPFGLEAFDFGDGSIPVGRLQERLDSRDQGFLLGEVLGPERLPVREVVATARKEPVTR